LPAKGLMGRVFKDKWSLAIEKHGYTDVPNILLYSIAALDITAPEFLTMTSILSFKWDENNPFPSVRSISARTNSSPRNVRKHIASLERKGLLKRIPCTYQTNKYDFVQLNNKLDVLAKSAPRRGLNKSHAKVINDVGTRSILTSKEETEEQDSKYKHNNLPTVSNDTDELSGQIRRVYEHFIKQFDRNSALYKLTEKRKAKIKKRLVDADYEMLIKAINNVANNEWYMGVNDHNWKADLDYITRSYEQVERLSQMNETTVTYKADW
jgi:DNA-binding MarR family transcriptional regulator